MKFEYLLQLNYMHQNFALHQDLDPIFSKWGANYKMPEMPHCLRQETNVNIVTVFLVKIYNLKMKIKINRTFWKVVERIGWSFQWISAQNIFSNMDFHDQVLLKLIFLMYEAKVQFR